LRRPAISDDIRELVSLYHQAFKGVFTEKLGDEYLWYFYEGIIKSGKCFVYTEDEKIVGFIAGVTDKGRLFTLKDKIYITCLILKKFLSFRIRLSDMTDFLRYFFWTKTIAIKAQLLLLIVEKNYRRKGIGTKLLERLMEYFREAGVEEFIVFSDDKVSQGVEFYLKRRFVILDKIKQRGFNIFCLESTPN